MMALRDPNTLDLGQQKLQLAPDLRFWPVRERGKWVYRIEIPKLHRFFRVGYEEYVFLSLLDGMTTIPQACGLAAAQLGNRAPTASAAGTIARWLLTNELAYLASDGPPVRRLSQGNTKSPSLARLLGAANPFWIKIPLPHCDRWINACAKTLNPLFDPRIVTIGVLVLLSAIAVLISRWTEFAESSSRLFVPGNWIWLLVSWIVLKVIHELAHAVVCNRQGGEVRESGIVFVLFAPLAYVDVSSCWRMDSRWSRIAVASAGMYVELVVASIATLLWSITDSPTNQFLLNQLIVTAGLSTVLFNANVLMRFDGYFILTDLIEVPNLYSEGMASARRLLRQIVTGESAAQSGRGAPSHLGTWRKQFVMVYGLAALGWRIMVCVTLFIAAATMFAGAGIVIACGGVVLWSAAPLKRLYQFAADLRATDSPRFARAVAVGLIMITTGLWLIFWLPIPTSVAVPAVVRYLPETMVRSRASGFVTAIHVRDGAVVDKNELLITLENRELSNRLAQLEVTWQQNQIRLRQATEAHNAGEIQILHENQKAVGQQMEQLRIQVAALQITAPRSGRVVARTLADRLGCYVEEGDSLLVVADEADKEIVAVIGQDAMQAARAWVGSEIRIRSASSGRTDGQLQRIEPRATDLLPDPALAATEGGPLTVKANGDSSDLESLRLLEPHFRARIGLSADVAAKLPTGSRMWASLGYRAQPVAARVKQTVRRLWQAAESGVDVD